MNKKLILKSLFATCVFSLLYSGTAFANGTGTGAVTVRGAISSAGCTLDSASYTYDLPAIPATDLANVGQRAGHQTKTIIVKCTGQVPDKINLSFTSPDVTVEGNLKNMATQGAANNVEIQIDDVNTGTKVDLSSGIGYAKPVETHGADTINFPMLVCLYSLGNVTVGKVLATATIGIVLP